MAIIRTEGDEKFLILKRKFRPPSMEECNSTSPSFITSSANIRMPLESAPRSITPHRQPPPYRAPPPPCVTPTKSNSSSPVPSVTPTSTSAVTTPTSPTNNGFEEPPVVPLRKKSTSEKTKKEHIVDTAVQPKPLGSESGDVEPECERKISVKERMQKFNRMASESDLPKIPTNNFKKKVEKVGVGILKFLFI